ncbi:MAG: NAD-dependent epimerase [Alphaproteobacteria bacterium]|nr:NAD-dependent epimerase [Alphaproteobacteria bacterium]
MRILVTGAAGFVGFHTSRRLLGLGHEVVGIDNLNDYYDPRIKEDRLAILGESDRFVFQRLDLADRAGMEALFASNRFDAAVNLAAQAGVRNSLTHPHQYTESNVTGFLNVLEGCRHSGVDHLVFASTSSVYGKEGHMPFHEGQGVNHPITLYAATKKANEMMAHAYSHLFGFRTTGLRFFTVYGPWGRPDMALFLFTKAILAGEPIKVFNHGEMWRDFTYVDDIVSGIVGVLENPAEPNPAWDADAPDPGTSDVPYRVLNIGNGDQVKLTEFIDAIEGELGIPAKRELLPMQPGDVSATYASTERLGAICGYRSSTPVREGIREFVRWYREYYRV